MDNPTVATPKRTVKGDVNRLELSGTVTSKGQLAHYSEGRSRLLFGLRVEGRDHTDFVDLVAWNEVAELVDKLAVGSRVQVAGRVRKSSWDKDGKKVWRLDAVAQRVVAE